MKFSIQLFVLILLLYSVKTFPQDTAHLESAELKIVVANNEPYEKIHRAGYSGISELYFKPGAEVNLFVPTVAGLNYEHIFSGDSTSFKWNIFEPRIAPMELVRLSGNKIELRQEQTEHWPLKSSITYELNGYSVDFVFTGTPIEDIWKKHGYIGVFFASYIHAPEEKGINFIGRKHTEKDKKNVWIYHLPVAHGVQSNHRPARNSWQPVLDSSGFPVRLVAGFSDLEYAYPFYYGVSGDKVFIMMFDNAGKDGQINFAQSPDGGGENNPAWDFIYLRKNYKVGKKFSFRARAVFKKFEGRDDVIKIFESWSGKKVNL